jgi:MFS family permease
LFNATTYSLFFPVLAERAFGAGAQGYAALLACFGVGALPGALAASSSGRPPAMRRVATLGWLTGVFMIGAAAAPDLALCCCVITAAGFVSIWFVAAANTLVQLNSPPQLRGRVMGMWTMALPGMNPVTAVSFGLATDRLGVRAAFSLAGALLVICGFAALLHTRVSTRPGPQPRDQSNRI